MTAQTPASSQPVALYRPAFSTAGTIVVFALLGPPVGGLVAWVFLLVTVGSEAAATLGLIAQMAYPAGIVPALLAGATVAIRDRYRGTRWFEALLVGLIVGVISAGPFIRISIGWAIILASMLAAGVCWRVTRRLRGRG